MSLDVRIVHPLFQSQDETIAPSSPLQLHIGEISVDKAMELNALWHSMLPRTQKGNLLRNKYAMFFGAEFDGVFYATAIWTSPVAGNRLKDGDRLIELRRFAIASDAPANTASRMLKVMRNLIQLKYPDIIGFISYQDESKHSGTIYKASGWTAASRVENIDWTTATRERADKQAATGTKTRWEYRL